MVCKSGDGADPDELKQNKLWYVGVILAITSSAITSMGENLQKFSFMREAKRSVNAKRAYLRQPFWVVGMLVVVGGSLVDFVALGFLPQSLATPVGGSSMVANVIFASLFLKEKFSRLDALGTSLILGGICIVAAFANKESDCYTVDELVTLYSEPLFVTYIVMMVLACAVIHWFTKRLEKILKLLGSSSPQYKRFSRLHPVMYPALSGIFGAQSVLFAKSVAELFKTTFEGTNQFVNVGTYLIVLSMFACVFLQIHWLAHGLQSFDAVFIVPVFQCFYISISIFGGGVYFKEFSSMPTLSLVMFFVGAGVTLSGVYLLSCRVMNVLRPTGKLRAAVKMIIFIKRVQKIRNMDYKWTQPMDKTHDHSVAMPPVAKSGPQPAKKTSKAAVVPIQNNYPLPTPTSGSSSETTTALDTSNSHIQITPKRFDK